MTQNVNGLGKFMYKPRRLLCRSYNIVENQLIVTSFLSSINQSFIHPFIYLHTHQSTQPAIELFIQPSVCLPPYLLTSKDEELRMFLECFPLSTWKTESPSSHCILENFHLGILLLESIPNVCDSASIVEFEV